MRKELGNKLLLSPVPVYMIGTYSKDGEADFMMMAWGGICDSDKFELNLDESHKTVENLKEKMCFSFAAPTLETLDASDYLGIVSFNEDAKKMEKSGLTVEKGVSLDCPHIAEYPVSFECEVLEIKNESYGLRVVGRIRHTLVDERYVKEDGTLDRDKISFVVWDQANNAYYDCNKIVGYAWDAGMKLK